MTTQPEALRLATALEKFWAGEPGYDRERQAAAELRRLSAVEAQRDALLEALKVMLDAFRDTEGSHGAMEEAACDTARAAIKAVEGA